MAEEDQKPDESGKPDETEGTDESVLDPEEQELRDALFQSTRPRGARLQNLELQTGQTVFQSTRPRGARPDHQ